MHIERLWVGNELRNFNYLIACPQTGEALAVDPLDAGACLARARERGWSIRQVFNTHDHPDHIGGNAELVGATGAQVLAHAASAARIGGVTRTLTGGERIQVGRGVELTVVHTPGHTLNHLCLIGHSDGAPALFAGDTLFNAGVGNCFRGGDPGRMYETVEHVIAPLPAATRLYPGHEYLGRNLAFTLDREPSNAPARALAERTQHLAPADVPVLTLGEEREVNVFFRLESSEIARRLRELPDAPRATDPRTTFLTLRALRDRW